VLEVESLTQSADMRRRYKFLSHLPLTASFTLCELDLVDGGEHIMGNNLQTVERWTFIWAKRVSTLWVVMFKL
jgi:hypothetical protein